MENGGFVATPSLLSSGDSATRRKEGERESRKHIYLFGHVEVEGGMNCAEDTRSLSPNTTLIYLRLELHNPAAIHDITFIHSKGCVNLLSDHGMIME